MSDIDQIYLTATIAAFIFFGTTLFSVYLWAGMTPKAGKPGRKPIGILVVTLAVSAVCAFAVGQVVRDIAAPNPPQLTAAR